MFFFHDWNINLRRLLILISYAATPLSTLAAQCVIDPLAQYTELGGDPNDNRIHVQADTSESNFTTANFSGAVNLRQGDVHVIAPKLDYDRDSATVTGDDGITVGMPQAAIKGEQGQYLISQDTARFQNAQYYLSPRNGSAIDLRKTPGSKGHAEKAEFNRQSNIDTLETITWTTCGREAPVWEIKAKHLILDHNTNRGVAKDMTFRIKGTPVFYFPYFSFPITNDRATGFLTPSIASSEDRGIELVLPFYWNIAPNQDATFTLHPMTKRGIMVEGQWRYLSKHQEILLEGTFLPSDHAYDHQNRWRNRFEHKYTFNDYWNTEILYQNVSDIDYLDDIDSGLNLYDDWYIERHARLNGQGDWGNLMLQVQHYKRVSPEVTENSTPYARLPQLTYDKTWNINGLKIGINSEAVRFQKKHKGSANRFTMGGEVSYRLSNSYGFLEPKLSYNIRHYQFNPDNSAFREGSKTVALPTFSLDSGLIFERNFSYSGEGYTQTLEPRLFYLYTPYKDQSDIPLFDTSDLSKSWNWLFARNRFSGGDRIGDANQLTTAVTTRFYRNRDGQEKARFSIGQIQYFRDRKVSLDNSIDNNSKSVIVSEGAYQIDRHWSLYALNFWDPNKRRNERNIADIRYTLDNDRYLSFGHRYNRDDYDQLSLGGGWRINPEWRLFARQDYSLRYEHNINTLIGVEYNDCCWAWRFVGRHYRNNPEDKRAHNTFYLEFIFKGLGNMGSSSGTLLKSQLNNFQPLPQEKNL